MNPTQYVIEAQKTNNINYEEIAQRYNDPEVIDLLHGSLGLCTEASEFADVLKKYLFYGKPIDKVNLVEEAGDLLWYCAIIARRLEIDFETIMEKNINKLRQRYGDKFSESKAQNRDLKKEHEVLSS